MVGYLVKWLIKYISSLVVDIKIRYEGLVIENSYRSGVHRSWNYKKMQYIKQWYDKSVNEV